MQPSFLNTLLRILAAPFYTGAARNAGKHRALLLLRFTWELPQTLIGVLIAIFCLFTGRVGRVGQGWGVTVLGTGFRAGAFSIGPYLVGPHWFKADRRERLFVHEYGHYLQSRILGPFYLPFVAMPSILDFWMDVVLGWQLHSTRWYEVWATRWGHRDLKTPLPTDIQVRFHWTDLLVHVLAVLLAAGVVRFLF